MKVKMKVLMAFCDKHTGKKHKKGDIVEVTIKRFNEITKNKYVELTEVVEETEEVKA